MASHIERRVLACEPVRSVRAAMWSQSKPWRNPKTNAAPKAVDSRSSITSSMLARREGYTDPDISSESSHRRQTFM